MAGCSTCATIPRIGSRRRNTASRPIDLLVVNLYPFRETVAKPGVTLAGSHRTDRHRRTVDAAQRGEKQSFRDGRDRSGGLRRRAGGDARATAATPLFPCANTSPSRCSRPRARTTRRSPVSSTASRPPVRPTTCRCPLVSRLRYGENSHQEASLYGGFEEYFQKLHGKELSFNNILDISAAAELIGEFDEPTIAILKHTNPVRRRHRPGFARGVGQGVHHR